MSVRYARPTISGGVAENKPQGRGGSHAKPSPHVVTAIFQGFAFGALSIRGVTMPLYSTHQGGTLAHGGILAGWQVGT